MSSSPFFVFLLLLSFLLPSSSLPSSAVQQPSCTNYQFANSERVFTSCIDLPVLNSFLHWNYNPTTRVVDIAYRHTDVDPTSTWVAWAVNPTSTHMIGSQAFVAIQRPNGTIRAYTSPVTSYETSLEEAPLSFPVYDISATFANNEITIFATFQLPENSTTVNQLWQDGPLIDGNILGMHHTTGPNVLSFGTLDFLSGHISRPTKGGLKNVHGILNVISWGILFPVGVISVRYLRRVHSAGAAWFHLHVFCQTTAYIVGVVGWATGLVLGKKSSGIQYDAHRYIGIVLFGLATFQVLALVLRPKPDHKIRFYWNIYHHMTGYAVTILSIVNIFIGINILDPEKKWKNIYMAVIVSLIAIALVLEAIFCYVRTRKGTIEMPAQAAQAGVQS